MKIYFWMINAPDEVKSYRVTVDGAVRSGGLPQTRENYLDGIGAQGTISILGWDSSFWNRISGGTSGYTGLIERGIYNIDFQTGEITLVEAPPEEPTPTEMPRGWKVVAMLVPWSPIFGPPLPKGFFPPWPMWMSRWTETPGYPKIPK